MFKTIATVAAAALVMGTVMVSGTSEAQARPGWGLGLGIGLAAGALIGAAAASNYAPYAPAYVVPPIPAATGSRNTTTGEPMSAPCGPAATEENLYI